MDKYICLKKSDVVIPVEGEEESSSDEEDGDDDEDDEDEDEEDEEGSDNDDILAAPPSQTLIEAEVKVEEEEEDVSDSTNCTSQRLILGIGTSRQSHRVLGCVEGHCSISRGRD